MHFHVAVLDNQLTIFNDENETLEFELKNALKTFEKDPDLGKYKITSEAGKVLDPSRTVKSLKLKSDERIIIKKK